MKQQLLLFSFSLLLLFSCKKDTNTPDKPTNDKYIIYKANGQQKKHLGEYSSQQSTGVRALQLYQGLSRYRDMTIEGISTSGNSIGIRILADSIKSGQTYQINDPTANGRVVAYVGGKAYLTNSPSVTPQYSITVFISKHADGWITGTFSGKIGHQPSLNSSYEDMTITEGSFQTKVLYQQ